MALNPQSVVVRRSNLPAAAVDSDLVILNMAASNYVGLDEIGRRVWGMLEQPIAVDALCRQLETEYAGAPETIERDVLDLLGDMRAQGLVDIHG